MIFGFKYFDLLVNTLGILGIACTVLAFQCKRHSFVLGFRTGNELLFALQYLLLGGYTGATLNIISSIRNIIFSELVKRGKKTTYLRIFFSIVFVISSIFTWNGIPSIIFCAGKIITTFAYGSKDVRLIRIMTVLTSVMWIIYNCSVSAYLAIASDVLTILSTTTAIIRIDIIETLKRKRT